MMMKYQYHLNLSEERQPGGNGVRRCRLAAASGRNSWEEFLALDDVLTSIGQEATHRLAFQASYPVRP
jgi:hypothetical protein